MLLFAGESSCVPFTAHVKQPQAADMSHDMHSDAKSSSANVKENDMRTDMRHETSSERVGGSMHSTQMRHNAQTSSSSHHGDSDDAADLTGSDATYAHANKGLVHWSVGVHAVYLLRALLNVHAWQNVVYSVISQALALAHVSSFTKASEILQDTRAVYMLAGAMSVLGGLVDELRPGAAVCVRDGQHAEGHGHEVMGVVVGYTGDSHTVDVCFEGMLL